MNDDASMIGGSCGTARAADIIYVDTPEAVFDGDGAVSAGGHGAWIWAQPVRLSHALAALAPASPPGLLGASLYLTDDQDEDDLARLHALGGRLICWTPVPGASDAGVRSGIAAASRIGLWNHVRFPGSLDDAADPLVVLAGASPDILHSWQVGGTVAAFGKTAPDHPLMAGYGAVAPLPGMPLWRSLGGCGALLQCIGRLGAKRVMRRRVAPDTGAAWDIGADMAWHFLPPDQLPPGVLDAICLMVAAGGSVNTRFVRHNLSRAFLIAYVTEGGHIVGNSSLKHPRDEYIASVRERYGLDFSDHLERGYTSVRPEYRGMGIGTKLLEGLTARAAGRKIFSIIAEDNIATQKIAIRNRTRKVATVYSAPMGKEIGFWIPLTAGDQAEGV